MPAAVEVLERELVYPGIADVVVGGQRGDEAKSRFGDEISLEYDITARWDGGDNAGHTMVLGNGRIFKFNMLPLGVMRPGLTNVIGPGVFVNAMTLAREIAIFNTRGVNTVSPDNLLLGSGVNLILPYHISADEITEAGEGRQGSTQSGIRAVAAEQANRTPALLSFAKNNPDAVFDKIVTGLEEQVEERQRVGLKPFGVDIEGMAEEYMAAVAMLGEYVTDTTLYIHNALKSGKRILGEGAQGFLLDRTHGMVPMTTSTSTISGGICEGLGVPPHYVRKVFLALKAVQSHVGGGPFVTEAPEELQERLHGDLTATDAEKGTKTDRTRRLGYFDLAGISRAIMLNSDPARAELFLSKLDWVPRFGRVVRICTSYERKGSDIEVAPDLAYKLEESRAAQFEELPTWKKDISDIRDYDKLPKSAKRYIEFIEDRLGVPITMIGVGQRRGQVIDRR